MSRFHWQANQPRYRVEVSGSRVPTGQLPVPERPEKSWLMSDFWLFVPFSRLPVPYQREKSWLLNDFWLFVAMEQEHQKPMRLVECDDDEN